MCLPPSRPSFPLFSLFPVSLSLSVHIYMYLPYSTAMSLSYVSLCLSMSPYVSLSLSLVYLCDSWARVVTQFRPLVDDLASSTLFYILHYCHPVPVPHLCPSCQATSSTAFLSSSPILLCHTCTWHTKQNSFKRQQSSSYIIGIVQSFILMFSQHA